MSIPVEPSLFQDEVKVFKAQPCKKLSGPDVGSVLWLNIADLSNHCCHFSADAGGWALSIAKFHWQGALRSAHKSCTHGHMS